jgi:hypothetical protein
MTVADPTMYVAAMTTVCRWILEWRTLTNEGSSMASSGVVYARRVVLLKERSEGA